MKHLHFASLSSTNQYLKDHYSDLDHLTLVSATHQTHGRGRYQRLWYDDETMALFSLLIKNQTLKQSHLPFVAATAIHQLLESMIPGFLIKWPNDILYQGKKICGILCEAVVIGHRYEAFIIGIGVNLNTPSFPDALQSTATSLKLITNKDTDIPRFIQLSHQKLTDTIEAVEKDYINPIDYCNRYSYFTNRTLLIKVHDRTTQMTHALILPDGSLALTTPSRLMRVQSGEISILSDS
jgi:BirA family biotin operon repressor/biotin-[acetyl-CoA-carboxylase] ligase